MNFSHAQKSALFEEKFKNVRNLREKAEIQKCKKKNTKKKHAKMAPSLQDVENVSIKKIKIFKKDANMSAAESNKDCALTGQEKVGTNLRRAMFYGG